MKRALLLTLMTSICTWTSVASAQDFDPKEAIVGEWLPDVEAMFQRISDDPDPGKLQNVKMAIAFMSRNIMEIRADGTLVKGGVENPKRYMFSVNDDGFLWMMLPEGHDGPELIRLRFDDVDHFVMMQGPNSETNIEIAYVRVFPSGMLAEGKVHPESEHKISGIWELDSDRHKEMPWIKSITDPRMHDGLLNGFQANSKFLPLGFQDGGIYVKYEKADKSVRFVDYTILAADQDTLALTIHASPEPEPMSFLIRVEIVDENHITILWTAIAPGPIPLVRSKEDALP